jgi:histone H3/H4
LPKYVSKSLPEISGNGVAEVSNALSENTGTAKSFTDHSEKALLNGSQLYFSQVGKKAIEIANKKRRTVVELPDVEKAISRLNSAARSAALYSGAGVAGSIGGSSLLTVILSPHGSAFWTAICVSVTLCAVALVLTIVGVVVNVRS